ncbi:hypothetical protein LXN10_07305 [Arcobacter sp. KX21116]|jgi:hypothetical protein|uniref:hypothetical protein n=1 Tax=Arcobacter iocasae TaxID=2906515 RepID=UPI0035D44B36|tara:strand:+ start:814 stop:1038 length:225 start_codon:yes stop_codon:yes gene_type:complete
MTIKVITENEFPEVSKMKKKFNIFSVVGIKNGELESVEFFGKNGVFRAFGKNTQEAYKKATKVVKKYYKEKRRD